MTSPNRRWRRLWVVALAGVAQRRRRAQQRGDNQLLCNAALLLLVVVGGALAGFHAFEAFSASSLGTVFGGEGSLDEAAVGEGDDIPLVGDEVGDIDIAVVDDLPEVARHANLDVCDANCPDFDVVDTVRIIHGLRPLLHKRRNSLAACSAQYFIVII